MKQRESMMTKQETLKIPALHCGSCVETVTRILTALPSVAVTKLVHVQFDESEVNLDQIREALEEVGFFPED